MPQPHGDWAATSFRPLRHLRLPMRSKAPFIHTAPAGTKRISFTHEDSVWITVHENPTEERDTDELERMLVADSEEEYEAFLATENRQCLS